MLIFPPLSPFAKREGIEVGDFRSATIKRNPHPTLSLGRERRIAKQRSACKVTRRTNETRSRAFEWRNRFDHHPGNRNRGRLRNLCVLIRLRPAASDRNRCRPPRCKFVRRKGTSHCQNRYAHLWRLGAY